MLQRRTGSKTQLRCFELRPWGKLELVGNALADQGYFEIDFRCDFYGDRELLPRLNGREHRAAELYQIVLDGVGARRGLHWRLRRRE